MRPAVDWDKGRAVDLLTDEAPDGWLPMYVGDDRTDEDAFRVLDDGVGVLVGERETAADYRLEAPRDVREFLDLVAEAQCE
ncbi:trehalose-phosphatase [Halosimplex aquaticum]